jgi:hypothetical protein
MYRIQEMMRERHCEDPYGRTTILPAIIQPKNLTPLFKSLYHNKGA